MSHWQTSQQQNNFISKSCCPGSRDQILSLYSQILLRNMPHIRLLVKYLVLLDSKCCCPGAATAPTIVGNRKKCCPGSRDQMGWWRWLRWWWWWRRSNSYWWDGSVSISWLIALLLPVLLQYQSLFALKRRRRLR